MTPLIRILIPVAICVVGCDKHPKPKFKPAPSPTPRLGPPAQRITSADRLRADEAMTANDLSLMLRANTPEDEIVRQIVRRGFVEPFDAAKAQSLATLGASPRLISIVRDPQYVLTDAERRQYLARSARRDDASRAKTTADLKQREAKFDERQKQLQLQQQAFDDAQKEREAKRRAQAKATPQP